MAFLKPPENLGYEMVNDSKDIAWVETSFTPIYFIDLD